MEQKLKEIMSALFEIPVTSINYDTSWENVEKWNSLNQLNLILALEESFEIELAEDDILAMKDFKTIIEVLGKRDD
jgi:acyl carrier protein